MTTNSKTLPVLTADETQTYLRRALELLEAPRPGDHPNSWVQGTLAIDINNKHCDPKSDIAVAYCVLGAVEAVTPSPEANKYVLSILNMANPNIMANDTIPHLNDQRNITQFSNIQKLFNKAIQLCWKL